MEECSPMDRTSFGIAPADFVFLAIFDLLSVSERKNPLGILTAFRAAFGTSSNTRLILKINHAEHRPAEMTRIREAASGMAVTIIDRTMDRAHVNGLIHMSDCLVSLHRSEGFGFTMAEAMYLAKPVIATAYSGNLDFTTADNSFLVGYDLVPVPPGCEPYDPGILWAEPRIGDAVCQMRLVASDPEIRCARGRAGQGYIQKHFSSEAVGRLMMDRLSVIQRILRAPRHVSESVIEIEKHAASAGS
jgi:glycosyltransferase involved in cell wall biosynthesis